MKRSVRRSMGLLGVALMAAQFVGASPAPAGRAQSSSSAFEQATPLTAAQQEVDRLLKQISGNAVVAGRSAEQLESFTRVGARLHYETHAAELNRGRLAINAMGLDLRRLQELRPSALPWQQMVIDRTTPMVAGMASHATDAIQRLNESRRAIASPEYRDAIINLYGEAGQARNLIAVNLDYAEAREKLNRLNAGAEEAEAKGLLDRDAARASSKPVKSLEQRVRAELVKLPYYGVFDYLTFRIDGDQVRLSGEVSWPVLKTDAERAVRGVEGVAGVTSDIKVLPVSPNDNRIRMATYWAIYGHSNMVRYRLNPNPSIRIIVENGHVTLKGVVRNEMDRSIAHAQATGVPGAFSVTNNLQLES